MKTLFTISLMLFVTLTAFSQIKATTDNGRPVLLMRDGTWKFADQQQKSVSYDCNALTQQDASGRSASSEALKVNAGGSKSVAIFIRKEDNQIAMLLNVQGAGNCMQKGSALNLLFRDGATLNLNNGAEANCDNNLEVNLGNSSNENSNLNMLKNKELASIRVYTKDGNATATFNPEQSKVLLNTVWCLMSR